MKFDIPMMKTAMVWAEMSKCQRLKVGAVIAKENNIISVGYNGTPSGFKHSGKYEREDEIEIIKDTNKVKELKTDESRVIHAEQNALMFAARLGHSTDGATLYVTHSPCSKCAQLIAQAGIKRVVFKEKYRDDSGLKMLKQLGIKIDQLEI